MLGSLRSIMKGLSRSMVYNEVMGIGISQKEKRGVSGVYCIVVFSKVYYYRPPTPKKKKSPRCNGKSVPIAGSLCTV